VLVALSMVLSVGIVVLMGALIARELADGRALDTWALLPGVALLIAVLGLAFTVRTAIRSVRDRRQRRRSRLFRRILGWISRGSPAAGTAGTAGGTGAAGGGICEIDPNSTCIDPLDPTTGFETYIVPVEATIALGHILGNDPRPHYAHQSNLAEERILLPVIDEILARYRDLFAPTAPLLSPTMTESAELLRRRAGWEQSQGTVSAYVQDGVVVVTAASPTAVPLTVPAGTRHDGADFGSPYAGRRSAWTIVTGTASFELGATA